jgi:hypothetical protein
MIVHDRAVAYVGDREDHRANFVWLIQNAGRRAATFDDSVTFVGRPRQRGLVGLVRHLRRWHDQWFGTSDRHYVDYLLTEIDTLNVGCLIGYWGTRPLGDLIAVKRRRPEVSVVLNVLCHPLGLTRWAVAAQNRAMRRAARFLDGIIFPSREMGAYFDRQVFRGRQVPSVVVPPLLAEGYHPVGPPPPVGMTPSLIFLGRMGQSATIQPTDDVTAELARLMDQGIDIYHHATPDLLPAHPRRHTFEYQPLVKAIEYCRQFDASLVLYNTAASWDDSRFRITVPDRLIAGVAAGIPIAIPRRGYEAAKEYLINYRSVILFDSAEELWAVLSDRSRVAALKAIAERDRFSYVAERHLGTLMRFLDQIMGVQSAPALQAAYPANSSPSDSA